VAEPLGCAAAAASITTTVSVRRTRCMGSDGLRQPPPITGPAFAAPAGQHQPVASRVHDRWGERHPHEPVVVPAHRHRRGLSITGSPGGHEAVCPSSPMPRCTTSNRSGSRAA
jgi:hypothetical protein